MDHPIEAIYEDGVLRPLEKLSLHQKQRVFLHIDAGSDVSDDLEDKAGQSHLEGFVE